MDGLVLAKFVERLMHSSNLRIDRGDYEDPCGMIYVRATAGKPSTSQYHLRAGLQLDALRVVARWNIWRQHDDRLGDRIVSQIPESAAFVCYWRKRRV